MESTKDVTRRNFLIRLQYVKCAVRNFYGQHNANKDITPKKEQTGTVLFLAHENVVHTTEEWFN